MSWWEDSLYYVTPEGVGVITDVGEISRALATWIDDYRGGVFDMIQTIVARDLTECVDRVKAPASLLNFKIELVTHRRKMLGGLIPERIGSALMTVSNSRTGAEVSKSYGIPNLGSKRAQVMFKAFLIVNDELPTVEQARAIQVQANRESPTIGRGAR